VPARTRLDQLILARGLATSRAQAQALLLAGRVRVGDGPGGRRDRKAGDLVPSDVAIALDAPQPYVSRGG
jgi:23S rRNA (cytidine1920-2'-O)/16S rRNA (cytidine1409-2'-O)-methyltransferase